MPFARPYLVWLIVPAYGPDFKLVPHSVIAASTEHAAEMCAHRLVPHRVLRIRELGTAGEYRAMRPEDSLKTCFRRPMTLVAPAFQGVNP
jgi:hypothetical protein